MVLFDEIIIVTPHLDNYNFAISIMRYSVPKFILLAFTHIKMHVIRDQTF